MKKSAKQMLYFLVSILLIQTLFILEKKEFKTKKEFIIFHKSRFSIIGKRIGTHLYLQHDFDSLHIKNDYSIKSYRIGENLTAIQKTNFNNYLKFADKSIVIVDSLGIYKIKNLRKPLVVLQYSPKINIERLIKTIKPSQIIADGSNYKSYVLRWEKKCLEYQIPFHYTGQDGAFILRE